MSFPIVFETGGTQGWVECSDQTQNLHSILLISPALKPQLSPFKGGYANFGLVFHVARLLQSTVSGAKCLHEFTTTQYRVLDCEPRAPLFLECGWTFLWASPCAFYVFVLCSSCHCSIIAASF